MTTTSAIYTYIQSWGIFIFYFVGFSHTIYKIIQQDEIIPQSTFVMLCALMVHNEWISSLTCTLFFIQRKHSCNNTLPFVFIGVAIGSLLSETGKFLFLGQSSPFLHDVSTYAQKKIISFLPGVKTITSMYDWLWWNSSNSHENNHNLHSAITTKNPRENIECILNLFSLIFTCYWLTLPYLPSPPSSTSHKTTTIQKSQNYFLTTVFEAGRGGGEEAKMRSSFPNLSLPKNEDSMLPVPDNVYPPISITE